MLKTQAIISYKLYSTPRLNRQSQKLQLTLIPLRGEKTPVFEYNDFYICWEISIRSQRVKIRKGNRCWTWQQKPQPAEVFISKSLKKKKLTKRALVSSFISHLGRKCLMSLKPGVLNQPCFAVWTMVPGQLSWMDMPEKAEKGPKYRTQAESRKLNNAHTPTWILNTNRQWW